MFSTIVLQFDAGSLTSMLPFVAMIGVLYFFYDKTTNDPSKEREIFSNRN